MHGTGIDALIWNQPVWLTGFESHSNISPVGALRVCWFCIWHWWSSPRSTVSAAFTCFFFWEVDGAFRTPDFRRYTPVDFSESLVERSALHILGVTGAEFLWEFGGALSTCWSFGKHSVAFALHIYGITRLLIFLRAWWSASRYTRQRKSDFPKSDLL